MCNNVLMVPIKGLHHGSQHWKSRCAEDSNNNSIMKNNVTNNKNGGIYLDDSSNNIIYLNSFIDNTYNVRSYKSTNI